MSSDAPRAALPAAPVIARSDGMPGAANLATGAGVRPAALGAGAPASWPAPPLSAWLNQQRGRRHAITAPPPGPGAGGCTGPADGTACPPDPRVNGGAAITSYQVTDDEPASGHRPAVALDLPRQDRTRKS